MSTRQHDRDDGTVTFTRIAPDAAIAEVRDRVSAPLPANLGRHLFASNGLSFPTLSRQFCTVYTDGTVVIDPQNHGAFLFRTSDGTDVSSQTTNDTFTLTSGMTLAFRNFGPGDNGKLEGKRFEEKPYIVYKITVSLAKDDLDFYKESITRKWEPPNRPTANQLMQKCPHCGTMWTKVGIHMARCPKKPVVVCKAPSDAPVVSDGWNARKRDLYEVITNEQLKQRLKRSGVNV